MQNFSREKQQKKITFTVKKGLETKEVLASSFEELKRKATSAYRVDENQSVLSFIVPNHHEDWVTLDNKDSYEYLEDLIISQNSVCFILRETIKQAQPEEIK